MHSWRVATLALPRVSNSTRPKLRLSRALERPNNRLIGDEIPDTLV